MRPAEVVDASVAVDIGAGVFLTVALVVGIVACILTVRGTLRTGLDGADLLRRRRLARDRSGQARRALVEASLEKDYFELEEIELRVRELLGEASRIWRDGGAEDAGDRGSALAHWARSVIDVEGPGARITSQPVVDVLRVVNRAGESEDRVILRVRFRARQPPDRSGEQHTWTADMRWTLGRAHSRWVLLAVDGDPLADGALRSRLIPARWADDDRLAEESLLELADGDRVPAEIDLAVLVSAGAPADQQLRELAQLDGRFDPDLLDARLRHIVEAWEEACTGSADPLCAVASVAVMGTLLRPRRGMTRERLMLRDATLERWSAVSLALAPRTPARLELSLTVAAVRYLLRNPDGRVIGDRQARGELALRWTLELSPASSGTWELAGSTNPAMGIPGPGSRP